VSLKKEKNCREISEDKIAVCEKTQGLRSGNFSDLNSACSKVLVPVKIFQFHDMHYESERYRDAANDLIVFAKDCSFHLLVFEVYVRRVLCELGSLVNVQLNVHGRHTMSVYNEEINENLSQARA
jgi:hypothetical protein